MRGLRIADLRLRIGDRINGITTIAGIISYPDFSNSIISKARHVHRFDKSAWLRLNTIDF